MEKTLKIDRVTFIKMLSLQKNVLKVLPVTFKLLKYLLKCVLNFVISSGLEKNNL